MLSLKERTEIATALNFGKYPVLEIDISKCDEYGLVGSYCRIDFGTFDDGQKWYEPAQLRVYGDEQKLTFSGFPCCLDASYGYRDLEEQLRFATAPIIKANSEFVVVIHDSVKREGYGIYIVSTEGIHKFCQTPIMIERVDMSTFVAMAKARYGVIM